MLMILLVASASGKRRINVLIDQLQENKARLSALGEHETQYVELQQALHALRIQKQKFRIKSKNGKIIVKA